MAFLCTVLILLISSNIDATFAVVRCPVSAEWRLQAWNKCPESQQKYVCIFNIIDKQYQENCRGPDYSVKGGKLVFNPNFDLRACDYKRYQPFVFSTIAQSDCVFLKSDCSEEGQVAYNNGSSSTDKACRCDYTKGYSFVKKPRDLCFCVPSEEDCSCYKTSCTKLSPDYECINNGSTLNKTKCGIITSDRFSNGNLTTQLADNSDRDIYIPGIGTSYRYILTGGIITLIVIFGVVFLKSEFTGDSCILSIRNMFIKRQEEEYIADRGSQDNKEKAESRIREEKEMTERGRPEEIDLAESRRQEERDIAEKRHQEERDIAERRSQEAKEKEERRQEEISKKKRSIHDLILRGEHGLIHFVRIFFVGKNGVGKTSLMRRLLWESGADIVDVESTDGIDIRTCRINVENGKWTRPDSSDDNLVQLIRRTFAKKKESDAIIDRQDNLQTGIQSIQPEKQDEIQIENKDLLLLHGGDISSLPDDTNQKTKEKIHESAEETNRISSDGNKSSSYVTEMPENSNKESQQFTIQQGKSERNSSDIKTTTEHELDEGPYEEVDESEIGEITASFLDSVLEQSDEKLVYETFASCWFWDFAGQKDFYATHQTFLASCAIFLLVTDGLEGNKTEHKHGDFEKAAEYISFWFDTIHCYWSLEEETAEKYDPPVIVVCTHGDKYKGTVEKKKREEEFQKNLLRTNEKAMKHIRKIHFLSNTENDDTVFETIRQNISEIAKQMTGWGCNLSLKWILFEQLMQKLRDSKISILPINRVREFAKHKDIGITEETDFENCLKYFHDIGSIIYFNEDRLRNQVILNPKWLVDAFRCLVSHKIDDEIIYSADWSKKLRVTGELTYSLLTKLLKKKSEFDYTGIKHHLIEVMKKFDIVVQIKETEALYMPCMMEAVESKFGDILGKKCKKTSWCCFEFDFLPPAFFNHILAWYIRKYNVSRETDSERFELYRGVGVFNLDGTRCEQLIVCEAKNIVAIQVHVYGDISVEDTKYSGLKRKLNKFITKIKTRYKMNLSITVSFKCGGDFRKDRWTLQELKKVEYYNCPEHEDIHSPQKIYLPWCELDEQSTKENIDDNSEHTIRDVGSYNKPYILGQDIFRLHHKIDLKLVIIVGRIENRTDGVMMDDGRLVLSIPCRLLTCNIDGSEPTCLLLLDTPLDITAVNNSTVAFTMKSSHYIGIYDINNKQGHKIIPVPEQCRGITHINNKLVVGCSSGKLLMIDDQTGEVVQTIYTDCRNPDRLHTSGDRIFYCDTGILNPKLYCYSYTDDKITTLTLRPNPYIITSLQDGSLYVGCEDRSVQHVSSDLQHYKAVKTEGMKLLNNYIMICYNVKQRKLITINDKFICVFHEI